jgi:hypothetical protein
MYGISSLMNLHTYSRWQTLLPHSYLLGHTELRTENSADHFKQKLVQHNQKLNFFDTIYSSSSFMSYDLIYLFQPYYLIKTDLPLPHCKATIQTNILNSLT